MGLGIGVILLVLGGTIATAVLARRRRHAAVARENAAFDARPRPDVPTIMERHVRSEPS